MKRQSETCNEPELLKIATPRKLERLLMKSELLTTGEQRGLLTRAQSRLLVKMQLLKIGLARSVFQTAVPALFAKVQFWKRGLATRLTTALMLKPEIVSPSRTVEVSIGVELPRL